MLQTKFQSPPGCLPQGLKYLPPSVVCRMYPLVDEIYTTGERKRNKEERSRIEDGGQSIRDVSQWNDRTGCRICGLAKQQTRHWRLAFVRQCSDRMIGEVSVHYSHGQIGSQRPPGGATVNGLEECSGVALRGDVAQHIRAGEVRGELA